jgi:hypothetical protein
MATVLPVNVQQVPSLDAVKSVTAATVTVKEVTTITPTSEVDAQLKSPVLESAEKTTVKPSSAVPQIGDIIDRQWKIVLVKRDGKNKKIKRRLTPEEIATLPKENNAIIDDKNALKNIPPTAATIPVNGTTSTKPLTATVHKSADGPMTPSLPLDSVTVPAGTTINIILSHAPQSSPGTGAVTGSNLAGTTIVKPDAPIANEKHVTQPASTTSVTTGADIKKADVVTIPVQAPIPITAKPADIAPTTAVTTTASATAGGDSVASMSTLSAITASPSPPAQPIDTSKAIEATPPVPATGAPTTPAASTDPASSVTATNLAPVLAMLNPTTVLSNFSSTVNGVNKGWQEASQAVKDLKQGKLPTIPTPIVATATPITAPTLIPQQPLPTAATGGPGTGLPLTMPQPQPQQPIPPSQPISGLPLNAPLPTFNVGGGTGGSNQQASTSSAGSNNQSSQSANIQPGANNDPLQNKEDGQDRVMNEQSKQIDMQSSPNIKNDDGINNDNSVKENNPLPEEKPEEKQPSEIANDDIKAQETCKMPPDDSVTSKTEVNDPIVAEPASEPAADPATTDPVDEEEEIGEEQPGDVDVVDDEGEIEEEQPGDEEAFEDEEEIGEEQPGDVYAGEDEEEIGEEQAGDSHAGDEDEIGEEQPGDEMADDVQVADEVDDCGGDELADDGLDDELNDDFGDDYDGGFDNGMD